MRFREWARSAASKNESWVCLGLDTVLARIPRPLLREGDPAFAFNQAIVRATQDLVCCYKANSACYEALGTRGLETLERTVELVHREARVPFILDGKRGDVGHTAEQYASAAFEVLGADAATVNPYLGRDAVEPFLRHADKAVFLLARTSNPSAAEFQSLDAGGRPLFERVVERGLQWDGGRGQVGFVAGATDARDLRRVRELAGPEALLLVPGVGAQGGEAAEATRAAASAKGENALIHASRSVLYASGGDDFAERTREACRALRAEVAAALAHNL